jgi:hypothetical protein
MASDKDTAHDPALDPIILGPKSEETPQPVLDREAQLQEAEAALAEDGQGETPAFAPLKLPPLVVPRRLIASMRPERIVSITAPGEWGEITLKFWINPPDLEVQAVARSRPMLSNFLAYFLRGWTLEYDEERDEQGKVVKPREPVPVDNESLDVLSADLIGWFGEQYRQLRLHPLQVESEPTSSTARESPLIGGGSTPSRNGSG